jgi:Sap, sulfolipid-1-addressing protein
MAAAAVRGMIDLSGSGSPFIAGRLDQPDARRRNDGDDASSQPIKADVWLSARGVLTSIVLGLVIVFSLSNSSVSNTTENTVNPAVDIALGAIVLVVAFVLHSGRDERLRERRRARKAAKPDKGPPRWRRELSKGSARTTFVVGALLTLPGASYLAGLHQIHKQHYSTVTTVVLVIGFNLVMLWLLEVPLGCSLVAPAWTPSAIERAKKWVSRHAHMFAVRGLSAVGTFLVIKGIIGLT